MGDVLARRPYIDPLFGERMMGELTSCRAILLTLDAVFNSVFDGPSRRRFVGVLKPPSSNAVEALELLSESLSSLLEFVASEDSATGLRTNCKSITLERSAHQVDMLCFI